jgi:signal transduction histidine kinase
MTDLAERTAPAPAATPLPRPTAPARVDRAWSLRRSLTVLAVVATVIATAMIVSGAVGLANLSDARGRVLNTIDPAFRQAEQLQVALVDQETGIRGYALGGEDVFLQPWRTGLRNEASAIRSLSAVADNRALRIRTRLDEVEAKADSWRARYANPILAQVRAKQPVTVDPVLGKQLFDDLRGSLNALRGDLDRAAADARDDLTSAARRLQLVGVLLAVGLVALLVVLALGLRRVVLGPLSGLADEVRGVAAGDFESEVHGTGPREVVALGAGVEAMRRQILAEFHALRDTTERLDERTAELERSNTELEQFAYVASHDLQEPLRKVASFTQLLERRYKGQLDERADQYIGFAVDGAKRMQVLINDLLAFSRVGRLTREHVEIGADELVDQALANLSMAIEESGASVTVAKDMPRVFVDASLIVGVFQNLVGNAIKFCGERRPEIALSVADAGEEWEFSVADNGIGIEPEYADRIFVIFQRLHPKDAYPGTGIGLAMARKIIEYHGGRIWLDTSVDSRTVFRFTLPKIDTPGDAPEPTEETAG